MLPPDVPQCLYHSPLLTVVLNEKVELVSYIVPTLKRLEIIKYIHQNIPIISFLTISLQEDQRETLSGEMMSQVLQTGIFFL